MYKIYENWIDSSAYSILDSLLTSDTKFAHLQTWNVCHNGANRENKIEIELYIYIYRKELNAPRCSLTSKNLQKRELFELPTVVAFPNASSMQLATEMVSVILVSSKVVEDFAFKNWITCFVASVFPEPVTPVIKMDCEVPVNFIFCSAS